MQTFLEILKYCIPALIVFATVIYTLKAFLTQHYALRSLEINAENNKNIIPVKLQAYERLTVFCARNSADSLVYRLINADIDSRGLGNAMLITIQQEYEHNLSQQIYVSQNLWKIITLAKEQMQNIIASIDTNDVNKVSIEITKKIKELGSDPMYTALVAIKQEAASLL